MSPVGEERRELLPISPPGFGSVSPRGSLPGDLVSSFQTFLKIRFLLNRLLPTYYDLLLGDILRQGTCSGI